MFVGVLGHVRCARPNIIQTGGKVAVALLATGLHGRNYWGDVVFLWKVPARVEKRVFLVVPLFWPLSVHVGAA